MPKHPFYQYREFMIEKYGEPLYTIPIDMGFSCPNRNHNNSGGCTFCSEDGNRAKQTLKQNNIDDQIKEAIRFAEKRYNARKYIAYIQAYSANFDKKTKSFSCSFKSI